MADFDPCAEAVKLKAAIAAAITNGRVSQIQFASGSGSSRMTTRVFASIKEMRAYLTDLESECAKAKGETPKRFAFRAGGM